MSIIASVGDDGNEVFLHIDTSTTVGQLCDAVSAALALPHPPAHYNVFLATPDGEEVLLDGRSEAALEDVGVTGCDDRVVLRIQHKYIARAKLGLRSKDKAKAALLRIVRDGSDNAETLDAAREVAACGFMNLDKLGTSLSSVLVTAIASESLGQVPVVLKVAQAIGAAGYITVLAMQVAVERGLVDVVEAMLTHGVGADRSTPSHPRALETAIRVGNAEITALLVRHGASLELMDAYGRTPLVMAIAAAAPASVVACLLDAGADVAAGKPLLTAVRAAALDVVQLLIDRGAPLDDADDETGATPLAEAVRFAQQRVTAALLDAGADVNAVFGMGRLPIHNAAEGGFLDILRLLVSHGAGVDDVGEADSTPLALTAKEDKAHATAVLLELGACVHGVGDAPYSPLHHAARAGAAAVARVLLDHGARVDATTEHETTPLMEAAVKGRCGMLRLLLERGADINAADADACTPLLHAVYQKRGGAVRVLLEHGAAPEAADHDGCTPLSWAAQCGHSAIAGLLVAHGADTAATDLFGRTPTQWAAQRGHPKLAEMLENPLGCGAVRA